MILLHFCGQRRWVVSGRLVPGVVNAKRKSVRWNKVESYLNAKSDYESLLSKYDVFKQKEKSIEYAAAVVGLKPPKNR